MLLVKKKVYSVFKKLYLNELLYFWTGFGNPLNRTQNSSNDTKKKKHWL